MDANDLGMSDADFMNQSPDVVFDVPEEQAQPAPSDDVEVEQDTPIEDEESDVEVEADDSESTTNEGDVDDEEDAEEDAEPSEDEEATESTETNFEAEYNKILAPFKANGVDIQVKSPEEAIQLMQMGANYTKKMQGLQPNLKLLKMLEQNKLLDEGKLNYLINLNEGNPEAIAKLVQDKQVDLDSFDADESKEFKPKDYTVNEAEMKVAEVLSSIESTPTYARTIDVVGNKWDNSSKQTLSENPKLIAHINEHMANGIFDKVNSELERQRVFGGLEGLSDYDAYVAVGQQIASAGGFDAPKPVATTQVPDKLKDAARTQKRKAASSTKTNMAKTKKEEFNPLSLSDAEFEKLLNSKL